MHGKIALCFAVVMIGQAMSASVFDGEELKKIGEQFALSALSITNHFNTLVGTPVNIGEPQKNLEKIKSSISKGIADLETEVVKVREYVRKQADPTIVEKIDELEKEIKKKTAEAKVLFDDKIGKPVNDKFKEDVKKLSDSVLKTTKDVEATVNKAIDNVKKP